MSDLISLIISLASLVISIVALVITKKVYILSSRDYIPSIDFHIKEENFEIINKTRDIYSFTHINLIKIDTFGFLTARTDKICQVSFVTESKKIKLYDAEQRQKRIHVSFKSHGPCAYLCPYDQTLVNLVSQKIYDDYSINSAFGYALPSLRSICHIIEVYYKDKFLEMKSAIFKYQHFHGHGFEKFKISKQDLKSLLEEANIPRFEDPNLLWHFLISEKWELIPI